MHNILSSKKKILLIVGIVVLLIITVKLVGIIYTAWTIENSAEIENFAETEDPVELETEDIESEEDSSVEEVIEDITAPVIEGEESYSYEVGSTISYKQLVTVTDDSETDVDLDIDNSEVDINVPGEYLVIYTATDCSGNVTIKELIIEIYEKEIIDVEEDTIVEDTTEEDTVVEDTVVEDTVVEDATEEDTSSEVVPTAADKADEVLSTIITSGMTQEEKAIAIFDWCYTKISYTGVNNADSWTEAAYIGLTSRAGNCYTYYATARMLLTQAGITNSSITAPYHYWNLVDVGDGWLHFDTTYCSDGIQICLWTDAQLTEYYETGYKQRHDYDKSVYTDIN